MVRDFALSGEVRPFTTPAGEVAALLHVGSYDRLVKAHDAIQAWAAANNRTFGGTSWEIYGDWTEDQNKLETTIMYLLR